MRCLLPLYEILLPEAIMSVARSRLIQRFERDWMIYALFHCGVEYLISQNSGFWDSLYIGFLLIVVRTTRGCVYMILD